jgi:hypothetical protein
LSQSPESPTRPALVISSAHDITSPEPGLQDVEALVELERLHDGSVEQLIGCDSAP